MSNAEIFPILPYDKWWSEQPDGVGLHDPVSGHLLDPDRPPEFLLKNGRLRDGYDYIRGTSPGVPGLLSTVITEVYCTGGEERAEDLGDEGFEEALRGVSWMPVAVGHTVDGVMQSSGNTRELLPYLRNAYTERIANAALASGLGTFCVGLEVDMHGRPAGKTERTLQAMGDIARLQAYNSKDKGAERQALGIVCRNAVQWYKLLGAGERMQHESASLQARGDGPLQGVMLVAPLHDSDYVRKFTALGMAEVSGVQAIPDTFTDTMNFEDLVIQTCRIPYSWLKR